MTPMISHMRLKKHVANWGPFSDKKVLGDQQFKTQFSKNATATKYPVKRRIVTTLVSLLKRTKMTRMETYSHFLFIREPRIWTSTYSRGLVAGNNSNKRVFFMSSALLFSQPVHYLTVASTSAYMFDQTKLQLRPRYMRVWSAWPGRGLKWYTRGTTEREDSRKTICTSFSSL